MLKARIVFFAGIGIIGLGLLLISCSQLMNSNDPGPETISACTPDGESYRLAAGETPGEGIANAVIELRDVYHLLPAGQGNIDLENIGDAERVLLANSGDENDNMHAGQGIRVCASQLHVQSVNGEPVE